MIIGIPKEIKNNEFRVGMTPSGVNSFIRSGHTVYVQKGAGLGSGFSDNLYSKVGAQIFDSIEEVDQIYQIAIESGALDEGEPEQKMNTFYGGYISDLDGNKLVFCKMG